MIITSVGNAFKPERITDVIIDRSEAVESEVADGFYAQTGLAPPRAATTQFNHDLHLDYCA